MFLARVQTSNLKVIKFLIIVIDEPMTIPYTLIEGLNHQIKQLRINKTITSMDQPTSLFERFFSRPRPLWVSITVSLILLLLPFAAAYLDRNLDRFLNQGEWRVFLLAPTIIIYIWLVSPLMARTGEKVVDALRPLVDLDDGEFDQMVYYASRIKPGQELIAFAIGLLLGIVSVVTTGSDQGATWLTIFWLLSTSLMYGVLAWTIFIAVSSTRINAALHRQPLQIDILNPEQFEAVGRQSLMLALVFIGGITLSLLFTFQEANISSPEFWVTNILFVLFIVLIFFLSMRPTHSLLAAEKKRELQPVQARINRTCRDLVLRLDQHQESGQLPLEINALVAYEQRLLAARTWPYNVTMLRTLFFSVFIPLGSILARLAVDILLR